MFKKHILANAIIFALGASILTGCGGGSSTPSSSVSQSTYVATSTSGVASDGIIIGGTVTASSLDGSNQYGTATTGSDGSYTLKLSNYDGKSPILLTLTAGDGASMICDVNGGCGAIAIGKNIPLSNSSPIVLHTVLPADTKGGAVSAAITPWTDMAYQYINAHTGRTSSSADIVTANSLVNQIVGVNVVDIQPVDLTKLPTSASSEQLAYAVMNSVFARSVASGSNIGAAITALTKEFSDGKLASTEKLSPGNIAAGIDAQKSLIGSNPGASALINNIENTISGQTDLAPTPVSSSTLTAVGQAKQLVGQARTLGNSIAQLQSPADAFAGNLKTAGNVINNNSQALITSVSEVVNQVVTQLQKDQVTGSKTYTAMPIYDSQNTQVGTADVTIQTTTSGGFSITIVSSLNGGATSVNLDITSSLPVTVLSSPNTATSATTVSLTATGSVANSEAKVALNAAKLDVTFKQAQSISLTGGTSIPDSAINNATLSGGIEVYDLTGGASFKGDASVTAVALDSNALRYSAPNSYPTQSPQSLSLSSLSLNGTFADASGNTFTAKASVNLSNAAQFDAIGYLSGQKKVVYTYYQVSGQVADPYATVKQLFLQGSTGYMVDSAIYVNRYYDQTNNVTYLNGSLQISATETKTSFAQGTLGLYLALALKGYPNTTAAITVNRTELNAGDATVTLAQDGGITLTAVYSRTNAGESLSVSNPSGTKLVVTKTASNPLTGNVTLADGTQVGTVTQSNGLYIVRYADGTFETLQ